MFRDVKLCLWASGFPTFGMDHTAFVFKIKQSKYSSSIPNLLRLLDLEMTIIRCSAMSGTIRPTIKVTSKKT